MLEYIAVSVTCSLKTGKDDIINFYWPLIITTFVGEITDYGGSQLPVI
jgi:hypothetical protein